jgi:hypothetical protein
MKIYFCDICNESIPLKDINTDRITIEGGRIFCPKCAPKSVRSRPASAQAVQTLLVSTVVLAALLVALGWRLSDDLGDRMTELGRRVGSLEEGVRQASEGQVALGARHEENARRLESLGADLRDLRTTAAQAVAELDRRELASAERLGQDLVRAVETLRGEAASSGAQLAEALQSLQLEGHGHRLSLQAVSDRIQLLEDMLKSRSAGPDPAAAVPVPAAAPEAGTAVPAIDREAQEEHEINSLLVLLQDPDPAKRYAAIIELGRYGGPRVARALEGMLQDGDELIRVAAVDHLKKVGLPSSVPHLIAVLRDRDPFVRGAAKRALEAIAGTAVNFQAEASAAEREARVKEWERWWEANRERLLNG